MEDKGQNTTRTCYPGTVFSFLSKPDEVMHNEWNSNLEKQMCTCLQQLSYYVYLILDLEAMTSKVK